MQPILVLPFCFSEYLQYIVDCSRMCRLQNWLIILNKLSHWISRLMLHYVYISIRLKYSDQEFGFVHVIYVNEQKNSRKKSFQTKQRLYRYQITLKPYALNIAGSLWILWSRVLQNGYAIHSCLWIESWLSVDEKTHIRVDKG